MPLAVRAALPDDAPDLAALDKLVNPSPWTANQFAGACSPGAEGGDCALLVASDQQLLGYVVFSLVLDEACIQSIAVQPGRRREGVGRLLLASAISQATHDGASRCYLEVRESNRVARRFYERFGFIPGGERPNYYPIATGRESAVIMTKQLVEQEC